MRQFLEDVLVHNDVRQAEIDSGKTPEQIKATDKRRARFWSAVGAGIFAIGGIVAFEVGTSGGPNPATEAPKNISAVEGVGTAACDVNVTATLADGRSFSAYALGQEIGDPNLAADAQALNPHVNFSDLQVPSHFVLDAADCNMVRASDENSRITAIPVVAHHNAVAGS